MSDVGAITGSGGVNGADATSPPGPLSVADALAALKRHTYSSLAISDTVANIAKSLDSLQPYAAKITGLSATDATKNLTITGAQYQKDGAILALWGAGTAQTVSLTAAKAAQVSGVAGYVTSVSVADSRTNIQSQLDNLQSAATSGLLKEIVQTGTVGNLTVTAAQMTADQAALSKFKNQAYTLAVTNASVSDTLGLGANPALSTNTRVKSIALVDTTDAIANNLDQLQRVGLHLTSIKQTDPTTHLEITGDQYKRDSVVLGKFITSDLLDVMDASATQARTLAADQRVVTVDVQDTAKNIGRNWALLQNLTDSLTSVEVTDQGNAITLTADQFSGSETLLGKLTDNQAQTYKLDVTQVGAGDAATVAAAHNVESVEVSDTGASVVANLDALHTLDTAGQLKSITLTNPSVAMSMDVSRLQDTAADDTQAVLDKIKGGNYRLAVTGAATADVSDLTSNARIVSFSVADTSNNIESSLDSLYQLGGRLTTIEQSDSGTVLDLTQAQLDSRSSVLAKISGGYTANLTAVSAAKAIADAKNLHVGTVDVSDTGRNILANWKQLTTLGPILDSIAKTDAGALTLSADNYLAEQDGLVAKFDAGTTFDVTGATVGQATSIAADDAVTQIDVSDEATALQDQMASLETLADGGKLHSVTNQTPTTAITMDAADLTDAQPVLSLIKGGSYSLAVTGVDAADAKDLVANNHKIASLSVEGDAAGITANLSDLTALGKKLASITQTDAPAETLALTGDAFEQNAATLAKIEGGYLAVLSQVNAARAATYASNSSVSSLSVTDTGAALSGAWSSLAQLGDKLTAVTQSDSSNLQMSMGDWNNGQALRAKFSAGPKVSLSDVDVADLATLASDSAVQAIQVRDTASALTASLADLAAEAKVTQLNLSDPTVALDMTAQTYAASSTILGKVANGQYLVNLSNVGAADVATLAADTHVASMDVSDSAAAVAANFDDLAAAGNLDAVTLTDPNGLITLTTEQILDNNATLNKISNAFQLAATGATMADLADLGNVAEVSKVSINDTADQVSSNFADVLALGGALDQIDLSDGAALSLSETDWTAGAGALAKINGSYQVDLSEVVAGDVTALAANSNVETIQVDDAASNIAGNWDALVAAYDAGAGKLTGIAISDQNALTLTDAQQTAGADMIAALLPDETIMPA